MNPRYVIRPDAEGFTIQDIWTGQAAVVAMTPQARLTHADAEHTASLLNAASAERPANERA